MCRYVSLAEVENLRSIEEYRTMVRPLDYEFGLERNVTYVVVGVRTRRGTPWLYVAAEIGDREVQIVPAVLFTINWSEVPPGWQVRVTRDGDIDLMPGRLVAAENWFERYVDGEMITVDLVNHEVDRLR